MKLSLSAEDEAFRRGLVAFLEANCPPEAYSTRIFIGTDAEDDDGVMIIPDWAREWQACLFDNGWMIPSYTPELGGRDATAQREEPPTGWAAPPARMLRTDGAELARHDQDIWDRDEVVQIHIPIGIPIRVLPVGPEVAGFVEDVEDGDCAVWHARVQLAGEVGAAGDSHGQ